MARNKKRDKKAILEKLADVRVVEIACKHVGISRIRSGDFRASMYWPEKHHTGYAPRITNEPSQFENPYARFSED